MTFSMDGRYAGQFSSASSLQSTTIWSVFSVTEKEGMIVVSILLTKCLSYWSSSGQQQTVSAIA